MNEKNINIIAIEKIKRLEELINFEELEFTNFQIEYINYIIDYIKKYKEIRTAIFIGFKFKNTPTITAFTTEQFVEIKKNTKLKTIFRWSFYLYHD